MTKSLLRVGIDVRLAHWPGIGRYIEEIVGQMVADFPNTEFVLFGNARGAATLREYADPALHLRIQSPNVRFVFCGVRPFSVTEPWALARAIREAKVDVMHSPYINIPWLSAHAIPLVVTLHDFRHPDLAMRLRAPRTWAKRLYYEVLTRLALKRARYVVCVSEFLAGQVKGFSPRIGARIHVITHAAGASFFAMPAGVAQRQVATQFNLVGPYFLFVGTLKPHKNLLAVIRALAKPGVPDSVMLAVAAAPDDRYPEVALEVQRLGLHHRVCFLGHLEKSCLPALYNAAVATLLPSDYESFGLPVVESMACGTPVIASTQAALQEVGGGAAAYTDTTPDALAGAMQSLLADHAMLQQRRAACLDRSAQFSWKRSAEQLHNLYALAAMAMATARTGPPED